MYMGFIWIHNYSQTRNHAGHAMALTIGRIRRQRWQSTVENSPYPASSYLPLPKSQRSLVTYSGMLPSPTFIEPLISKEYPDAKTVNRNFSISSFSLLQSKSEQAFSWLEFSDISSYTNRGIFWQKLSENLLACLCLPLFHGVICLC